MPWPATTLARHGTRDAPPRLRGQAPRVQTCHSRACRGTHTRRPRNSTAGPGLRVRTCAGAATTCCLPSSWQVPQCRTHSKQTSRDALPLRAVPPAGPHFARSQPAPQKPEYRNNTTHRELHGWGLLRRWLADQVQQHSGQHGLPGQDHEHLHQIHLEEHRQQPAGMHALPADVARQTSEPAEGFGPNQRPRAGIHALMADATDQTSEPAAGPPVAGIHALKAAAANQTSEPAGGRSAHPQPSPEGIHALRPAENAQTSEPSTGEGFLDHPQPFQRRDQELQQEAERGRPAAAATWPPSPASAVVAAASGTEPRAPRRGQPAQPWLAAALPSAPDGARIGTQSGPRWLGNGGGGDNDHDDDEGGGGCTREA